MHLLYLGELLEDSCIVSSLKHSKQFDRITHFTKGTLDYTHVGMNPLPDAIVLKCDWENHELQWVKRYSPEIPKIFIVCTDCLNKLQSYMQLGDVFNLDAVTLQHDLHLTGLVDMILRRVDR